MLSVLTLHFFRDWTRLAHGYFQYDQAGFDYLGIALEVKNVIESLRKGITFVDIVSYAFQ